MPSLSPTESRQVRRASLVGLPEAQLVESVVLHVKGLPDAKFARFVRKFRSAAHGGEVTFRRWLTKLAARRGVTLSDLDEQLVRDAVFQHLGAYIK